MFVIDDYIFDRDRMIFYPKRISDKDVNNIKEAIPANDQVHLLKESMSKVDFNKLSARNKLQTSAGICLTYKCQLRCNYCSFSSNESNSLELSLHEIEKFVHYLIKNIKIKKLISGEENVLKLFFSGGGEPTYNWQYFVSVVEMIVDKCNRNDIKYEFNLTTNGMLSNSQITFISYYFASVMISFDGLLDLQLQNRVHSNEKLNSLYVVETIKRFLQKNTDIILRSTVWAKDFCRLREMCEYVFSSFPNILEWSVLPTIDTGRATSNRELNASSEAYGFLDYYLDMIKYAEEHGFIDRIDSPFFSNDEILLFCGSGNAVSPWLMPDRRIVSCLEAKDFKTVIGMVAENGVELYNQYADITAKKSYELLSYCENCIAYRFCRGGCPLKFLRAEKGSQAALKWECKMIQKYWENIFRSVLKGDESFGWYVEKGSDDQQSVLYLKKRAKNNTYLTKEV